MTSNALHLSGLIGAIALATLIAAAPAAAAYENGYGARHHSRIHSHHYGYRYGPAGVVRGAGVLADETASGLLGAWDALDCATFGYYCRR